MGDEEGRRSKHRKHSPLPYAPPNLPVSPAGDGPARSSVSREDEGGHLDRADRLKHLRDDDLVLYQDGEIRTAPAERHLHVCRGCRDRLRAIDLELTRLSLPRGAPGSDPPPAGTVPAWRRLLLRLAFRRGDRRD